MSEQAIKFMQAAILWLLSCPVLFGTGLVLNRIVQRVSKKVTTFGWVKKY